MGNCVGEYAAANDFVSFYFLSLSRFLRFLNYISTSNGDRMVAFLFSIPLLCNTQCCSFHNQQTANLESQDLPYPTPVNDINHKREETRGLRLIREPQAAFFDGDQ